MTASQILTGLFCAAVFALVMAALAWAWSQ